MLKSKSSALCSPWSCGLTLLMLLLALAAMGQQASVVPTLVNFKGILTDVNGKPLTGTVGVTFYLYKDSEGGAPLWMETQNVQPDKSGRYTVSLGATTSTGLPTDVFVSGEARWLGVQPEGQAEQPRVLLLSVPYALKAGDAETIGGLPASAFVLANSAQGNGAGTKPAVIPASSAATKNTAPPANPAVTGKGVVDFIPMWDTTSDIVDSVIFQKSSEIGIATTAPAATLDVNGKTDVRDTLTLFPKGTDSTLAISGTTFKVDRTGKVTFITGQTFPGAGTITGITTASGSGLSGGGTTGTLSLKVPAAGITNAMLADSKIILNANTDGGITAPGAMTLGSTYTMGLKPCSANQILQYSGTAWNCAAAAGTGTITGVTAGADLTGGGTSGKVTLNLDTTKVPQLNAFNTFSEPQTILASGVNSDGLDSSTNTPGFNGVSGISFAATGAGSGVWGLSLSPGGFGVYGTSASGSGVYGTGTVGVQGASSGGTGVYGTSAENFGVIGDGGSEGGNFYGTSFGSYSFSNTDSSFAVGAYGAEFGSTTETFGVWGYSESPVGVGSYGQAVSASGRGAIYGGEGSYGVWGDTGSTCCPGAAVLATADDNYALIAVNNSSTGWSSGWFENDESSSATDPVLITDSPSYLGQCIIDVSGNLSCNGSITPVVPVGGSRKVALNTISSPESWFEDAGSGQLSNGEALVNIEAVFGETVNTGMEYHVFLTPNGDCKGLYVVQKSPSSFVVRELGGGTSSIAFDYRIMAKRKGFEQLRLVDKTERMNAARPKGAVGTRPAMPTAQDIRKAQEAHLRAAHLAPPVLKTK